MKKIVNDIEDPRKDIFSALSCGRRIRILEIMKDKEVCGCDLIPILRIDQSAVSRHLSILKRVGLVEFRKQGVNVYYRIANPRIFELLSLASEIIKEREKKLLEKLK